MNFDFSNWALGVGTAIIVGVIGRLIYKAISEKLEKKPNLEWFALADFSAPELSIHEQSFDLFYAAKQQDAGKFTDAVIDNYRQELRSLKKAVKIKIANNGRGASEPVSILVREKPNSIVLDPVVATSTRETADKRVQIEIAAINKSTYLNVFLYGVSEYEIDGVFHKGIIIEKHRWANLTPFKQPRNHWLWLLWGITLGAWISIGIENLVSSQTANNESNDEIGTPSENEGESLQ